MKEIFYLILLPALLPPLFMLFKVYRFNKYDREPIFFVFQILILGVIFTPIAIPLESLFRSFFDMIFYEDTYKTEFIRNTIGVGFVEELVKWSVLKLRVWNNKAFVKRYDGIVYAVTASLGFASLENILYVLIYGATVSIPRAVFSIPGHTTFAIFMGYYYSRAKHSDLKNHIIRKYYFLFNSLFYPILLHGTFDFLLSDIVINSEYQKYFIPYVMLIDMLSIYIIKHEFKTNRTL